MAKMRKHNPFTLALLIVMHVGSMSIGVIGSVVALVFLAVYTIDRVHGIRVPEYWQMFFFYGLVGTMFFCIDYLVWKHFLKREF